MKSVCMYWVAKRTEFYPNFVHMNTTLLNRLVPKVVVGYVCGYLVDTPSIISYRHIGVGKTDFIDFCETYSHAMVKET